MHTLVGLQEITLILTVALGCGLLLETFGQPAILGYILAGVFLGPSGFELIQNHELIELLADLGVLMVLFVVGMSLNLQSFKRILWVALSTTMLQILGALGLAFGLGWIFGWALPFTLLVAFAIALSSTAVAVKVLENGNELNSDVGRLTLGILVAQDLAIVPMILILKDINGTIDWSFLALKILFALGILSLFVWYLSRQRKVHFFFHFTQNRPELPSLVSLAFCFGFAALSGFLQLSVAYGAFLAGLILGNSRERSLMLQVIMPIYSVLVMTFFFSVGLLIDVYFIWKNFFLIFFLLAGVLIFKTFMNFGILRLLRQTWPTTFLSGVVLSQMGEFSFLLVTLSSDLKVIGPYYQQLLITLTALSLAFSPMWLLMSKKLRGAYRLRAGATFPQTVNFYVQFLQRYISSIKDILKRKDDP
jgi:CPA2 family monovalent cation:H+ antiporter-2